MIDFLSRSPFPGDEDPYEQYGYPEPQVPSSSPGDLSSFPPHYHGYSAREFGDDYREWSRQNPAGNDREPQGDGSGPTSGFDDQHRRVREQYMPKALRSRSGSASDLHPKGDPGHNLDGPVEGSHAHNRGGSPHSRSDDSGIHLHPLGKKLPEVSRGERDSAKENRRSQELSFDFSKGFGPLISSERHPGFGMNMLQGSADYKMGLELYQRISDSDSDEHSG